VVQEKWGHAKQRPTRATNTDPTTVGTPNTPIKFNSSINLQVTRRDLTANLQDIATTAERHGSG